MKIKSITGNLDKHIDSNQLPPLIFVWITIIIAALTLVGWLSGIRYLSGQWGSYIPMAPITAVAFLFQGLTLFFRARLPGQPFSRNFALSAVSITSIFCLIVLIESIVGIKIGLEHLLSDSIIMLNQTPVGRTSPLTAGSFLLINIAILNQIVVQQSNKSTTSIAMFAISAAAINIVIIVGYAFGTPLLYGGRTVPTSLPTAIAFVSEGIGLFLMSAPHSVILQSWDMRTFKGRLLRAFMFPVVGIVFLETWFETRIEMHQPGNLLFFHAIMALVFMAVIVIVVAFIARRMGDSIEQSRLQIVSLARIIEENPDPVLRFKRDGSLSYANSVSSILLKFWNCEKPGDFLPDTECRLVSEALKLGANKKIEVMCGDLVYSLLIVPVAELDYVNIYAEDITERKQAELIIQQQNNQLHELNTSKDKFFSIIAHDLRAPFLGFLGLTQNFANNAAKISVQQLARFGSSMHQAANNLFNLLHNLLEWSQMQNGSISLLQKNISLSELINKNIEFIKAASEQKGISIINMVTEPLQVYADEKMLDSVLLNLLSNAVKFSYRNGTVAIGTKKKGDHMIEMYVRDKGVGIPKSDLDNLFKIDENVGRKGTEGELSTGLGLMLCKEFIEKNGGNIRVESEEGKGSTFSFTLHE